MGIYQGHRWGQFTVPAEKHSAALAAIIATPELGAEKLHLGHPQPYADLEDAISCRGWTTHATRFGLEITEPPERSHAEDLFLLAVLAPFAQGEMMVEIESDFVLWVLSGGQFLVCEAEVVRVPDRVTPITLGALREQKEAAL